MQHERAFVTATVATNGDIGGDCRLLVLELPGPGLPVAPGQFVMVRGRWERDPLLPRAFSVLDAHEGRLELLIKVVGRGTRLLAGMGPGARVSVLGPLGRPFPPTTGQALDLLVGGGSGIPPLFLQAKRAGREGLSGQVEVVYGGRTHADLPLLARLEGLGVTVFPCTEDGTCGAAGRVTDVLVERLREPRGPVRVIACGPLGMLRAVGGLCRDRGLVCFLSLETGMACGVGLCRGCMVPRAEGPGYLCTCQEGPVVNAEEVRL